MWSGGGAGREQPSEFSFFPPSKGPGCRVPGLPSKHFFQLSSCLVLLLSGSHTVAQASLGSVAVFRLPCARLVKQTLEAWLRSPCSQALPGLCTGLHCQPVPSRGILLSSSALKARGYVRWCIGFFSHVKAIIVFHSFYETFFHIEVYI